MRNITATRLLDYKKIKTFYNCKSQQALSLCHITTKRVTQQLGLLIPTTKKYHKTQVGPKVTMSQSDKAPLTNLSDLQSPHCSTNGLEQVKSSVVARADLHIPGNSYMLMNSVNLT